MTIHLLKVNNPGIKSCNLHEQMKHVTKQVDMKIGTLKTVHVGSPEANSSNHVSIHDWKSECLK